VIAQKYGADHMSANRPCRGLVLLLASSILGGCAHDVPATVDVAGMPNAEIALRRSVEHVDKEMSEIGRMRPAPRHGPAVVPAELQKIVAFEWEGPLEGAVEKLAGEVGYDVVVDSAFNVQTVSIGIKSGPRRVYEIFQAIGSAAGDRATVQVDAQHHRIEVIYHV
jgi:defect-in-organelle-trafficking protein DotD